MTDERESIMKARVFMTAAHGHMREAEATSTNDGRAELMGNYIARVEGVMKMLSTLLTDIDDEIEADLPPSRGVAGFDG